MVDRSDAAPAPAAAKAEGSEPARREGAGVDPGVDPIASTVDHFAERAPVGTPSPDLLATWAADGNLDEPALAVGAQAARAQALLSAAARYVPGEEIARGGMGRVLEATDRVLGRVVAVKEALAGNREVQRRFEREMRITARLEHPSIVPVYDAGVAADGSPFYVMRKVTGEPLEKLVQKTRALAERLALVPHVVAAAQAIAHAHARGVLHRDLKPSNILVGALGETVVIDWGLAKAGGEDDAALAADLDETHPLHTRAGAIFGTPGFMSPEQLEGQSVDARSDVYALGATLYFVLCKQAPHLATTARAMMDLAAAGPPPPIASVVAGVPRDLAWIVDKALAFAPARRYADAGELAAELARFLTGQMVASRHYTRRERLAHVVRRHRVAAIAVSAATVMLAVGGAISVTRVMEEQRATRRALTIALREQKTAQVALEQMTLDRARALLPADPTAALAAVRSLAGGERWREVRAIAAEARARGVCWGLAGPERPSTLALSPGGERAYSTSLDGEVWLHELARHTSRKVAQLTRQRTRATFAGEVLVAYDAERLVIVEPNAAPRSIASGEITAAAGVEGAVFAVVDGELRRVALDGSSRLVPVREAGSLLASPDGRRVAVATPTSLVLLAADGSELGRVAGGYWPRSWSSDGAMLAASNREEAVALKVAPGASGAPGASAAVTVVDRRAADGVFDVIISGGRLAVLTGVGPDGSVVEKTGDLVPRTVGTRRDFGLQLSRDEAIVAGRANGSLVVLFDRPIELRAPVADLMRLSASPRSRFLVAASRGHVLVWDLSAILPARREVPRSNSMQQAGGREILLGDVTGSWIWLDVDSGASLPFGVPFGPYGVHGNERGDRAVLLPDVRAPQAPSALLVHRGEPKPEALDGPLSAVMLLDDELVLGTDEGQVLQLQLERSAGSAASPVSPASPSSPLRRLLARSSPVAAVAAAEAWRAARFADGTLWRARVDEGSNPSGEQASLAPRRDDVAVTLVQDGDGRVFTSAGAQLHTWEPDGALLTVATLPRPITAITSYGRYLVASLDDGSLYRVDLEAASPSARVAAMPVLGAIDSVAIARRAGGDDLLSTRQPDGSLMILDVAANVGWRMPLEILGATTPATLSRDGTRLSILGGPRLLYTWALELPRDAAATARWLDELSNADASLGLGHLSWPAPP